MIKRILASLALLCASTVFAGVDANKASAAELDGVKGIGPAMSTKILDARKQGEFKDWQDFMDRVKGIGPGNAAKLSEAGLTVGGATFKAAEAKAAPKKDDKKMETAKATEAAPKK